MSLKKFYFLWKTILIFNLQQNLHTINWYCVCKVTVSIWRYYFESMFFIADDNQFWLASWKNIFIVRPLNKWAKYYNNWRFKSSDEIISEKQVKQIKNLVFWLWSAIIQKYSSKNVFSIIIMEYITKSSNWLHIKQLMLISKLILVKTYPLELTTRILFPELMNSKISLSLSSSKISWN